MKDDLHGGMSWRVALKLAERIGCRIAHVRRTGELSLSHPRISRRVRANARRKDIPRHVLAFLKRATSLSQDAIRALSATSPRMY